ncbi:S8 family serine peptidase [Paenibacillus sp. FSL K6-1096]|uniref:S8 family serine peptidase n=1 Tax=Paenibacillus sp. FSL K6-1096 TaxID=2921460 RepID=UPI0030EBCE7A
MNSIKVAIIDSGVNINHPVLADKDIRNLRLYEENGNVQIENDIHDVNGHGTAVAGIITGKCPEVEILSLGILDGKLKCRFALLKQALQYALAAKVHIINLSLGTTMEKYAPELQALCDEAERAGVVIVAAFNNITEVSYPASFTNVFGVKSEYVKNKYGFVYDADSMNVYANGFQQKVCTQDGAFTYAGGNSFASAHFSGILAHLMYTGKHRDKEWIINQLAARSLKLSSIHSDQACNRRLDIEKGLLFPVNAENMERIRVHQKGDPVIVGFYDYRKFDRNSFYISTTEGHCRVKVFTDLEEGLALADTLLIGDVSFMPDELKERMIHELITRAVRMGRNVLLKDALPPDVHAELYRLASEAKVFIKTRYI